MDLHFDIDKYLSKFKIDYNQCLFMDWKMLSLSRCPICFNKLHFPINKNIAFCNSKKHKTFTIRKEVLNRNQAIFR